jgi:inosine-uridine nucleoside N-ribohydrolase
VLRLALLTFFGAAALWPAAAPPVIFDTDIGNDIDDVLALAMLHALESRGECRLIGVTLTNPAPSAAPFVYLMNRYYGREAIPIGVSPAQRKQGADRKYLDATLAAAPLEWRNAPAASSLMPAPKLLRKLLAASREKVIVIQVGFSENLAALLDSGPDEFSLLAGPALIREKVALLSMMAGDFATSKPEYNVRINVGPAKHVIEDWPTPVVASGFEIGNALLYPAAAIGQDLAYARWHPVAVAYSAYMKMPYDRPTWDLTSVLQAIRPESGYFPLSPRGVIRVDPDGRTRFQPDARGNRQHLTLPAGQAPRVMEAMRSLVSQPPSGNFR